MSSRPAGRRLLIGAAALAAAAGSLVLCRAHALDTGRPQAVAGATGAAGRRTPRLAAALPVEAVVVRARRVQAMELLSGEVKPFREASVAAELSGRVTARPVIEGQQVAKGELLASLDAAAAMAGVEAAVAAYDQAAAARRQAESRYAAAVVETAAALQQARARLASALAEQRKLRSFTRTQELREAEAALAQTQAEEHLSQREADRYTELVADGAVAQQVLDRAQAALAAATARRQAAEQALSLARAGARAEDIAAAGTRVAEARAGLQAAGTRDLQLRLIRRQIEGLAAREAQAAAAVRQARIQQQHHRIVAPFGGRILASPVEVGEMVAAASPIVRIGEIDRVKVVFSVPEAARPALHCGQPVTITADAWKAKTFRGRITLLGFQADARTRSFPLEVTVDNRDERLLPNMVARLRLPVGSAVTRPLIPADAVTTDGPTPAVFVLRHGRVRRCPVALGAPWGSQVEVARGLSAGETIAAAPQRLSDGVPVRVIRR